ncbi:CHRD domain-containing protein [Denitromonas ohlonensis]|uniref:CHRD domain-containing protein n=3 Tax=Denitromonas TaxID=139331 RepID=A0A557RTI7_9RHOO|nr:CHRD domain-containing protein [Denitromonas ohlonensis]TVO74765.1 CHRD domain-containing protein [Denitromonas ohlonensis]
MRAGKSVEALYSALCSVAFDKLKAIENQLDSAVGAAYAWCDANPHDLHDRVLGEGMAMRRFVFRCVALLSLCLGTAWADPVYYTANLAGSNEAPANLSPAMGVITLGYDATTNDLSVDLSFAALTGATIAAHLHCCAAPGVNAGVAVGLTGFVGGVTGATYSGLFDLTDSSVFAPGFFSGPGGGTVSGSEAALVAALAAGQVYINVHTLTFPGGEIRGNLQLRAVPVPEPDGLALLAVALLALGVIRYQRRGLRALRLRTQKPAQR